jgi:hypothetical protein
MAWSMCESVEKYAPLCTRLVVTPVAPGHCRVAVFVLRLNQRSCLLLYCVCRPLKSKIRAGKFCVIIFEGSQVVTK